MTNKREIKKYFNRVSQDVAGFILPAAVLTKAMTEEEAEEAILKISQISCEALGRLSIAFDKAPDSYDTPKAYREAKKKYFHEAYAKAIKDFEDNVESVLSKINSVKA